MIPKDQLYNDTSNTAAGINTPPDREDKAPEDSISEAIEGMVDEVQRTFAGKTPEKDAWKAKKD